MRPLLLINPNSSTATTRMMVAMASAAAGSGRPVHGVTAERGPSMITTVAALDRSVAGVVEIGMREGPRASGVIVAAFGDPGAAELKSRLAVPVIGICEASMREAAEGGRRFAVATTTPDLVARIDAAAERLGLADAYAGTWLTQGDPFAVVADPALLERALADAVAAAISEGGAQAVIIGGGPLSRAAAALSGRFGVPVIAPVAAAVRAILRENGN